MEISFLYILLYIETIGLNKPNIYIPFKSANDGKIQYVIGEDKVGKTIFSLVSEAAIVDDPHGRGSVLYCMENFPDKGQNIGSFGYTPFT